MGAEQAAGFVVAGAVGEGAGGGCYLGAGGFCAKRGGGERDAGDLDVGLVCLGMQVLVACYEEGVRFGDEDASLMGKRVVIVLEEEVEFGTVSQDGVGGFVVDLERGGVFRHLAETLIRIGPRMTGVSML